jgi:hypothetical protein
MLLPIVLVELNRPWNQKSTTDRVALVAYLEFYRRPFPTQNSWLAVSGRSQTTALGAQADLHLTFESGRCGSKAVSR